MKKRVNEIEKYEFKNKTAERFYQIIAISALLSAVGLTLYSLHLDKEKNQNDIIDEDIFTEEISLNSNSDFENESLSEENENEITDGLSLEEDSMLDTGITDKTLFSKTIENSDYFVEYKEIRVEAVTNHVYEVPTGFKLRKNAKGQYVGTRKLNKITGCEDYIYQTYQETEGYKIIDHGAYFEILTNPKEYISYSIPEGYDLIEAEDGKYYGVKIVATPITKKLS